jgi:hypothetical protein
VSEGLERPDRLARLREAAGKMEEALRDEGFDEQGSHGVFVRWQRQTVEELGQLLVEAERTLGQRVETACGLMEESSRKFRDDEFRRAEILLKGGDRVLEMARQAALTAAAAGERAEKEFDASVSRIAEDMAVKLLQQSQRWLVLKQTDRNRRDAWRLAAGVAAVALGLFIGGYATAEWRKGKELEAGEATMAAVERCWKRPVMVRDVKGESVEMCRLQDLELKEDQAGQSGG